MDDATGRESAEPLETISVLRRYRALTAALELGYCVVEILYDAGGFPCDYRFLEVNSKFECFTGIPADQALSGKTIKELVPGIEAFWIETYGRVALTGVPARFESGSDAMGRCFVVHAFRIGDAQDRTVGLLFEDVTGRRRAEREERRLVAELSTEREKLQLLFEQAPAFIAVLRGPDFIFEYVNAAYYQLVGHRQILGKTVLDAIPEVAGQGYVELLRRVAETGEPFVGREMGVRLQRHPDSEPEERFVDFTFQALRETAGTISGILAYGVDVTHQVLAMRELAASEERFRAVFENAPDDAIVLMDASRRILAWNPAASRITGWSAQEAMGRSGDIIFTEEDRRTGAPQAETETAVRDGKAADERWHVKKDGSLFWANGTVSVLRNIDGGVRGFLKVFRDETAKRRETVALAFLRGFTERMVALRDESTILEIGTQMLGEHLRASRVVFAEIFPDEDVMVVARDWASDLPSGAGTYRLSSFGPRVWEALHKGTPLVWRDVAEEIAPEEGGAAYAAVGVRGRVVFPVMREGRLVALLAVHQSHPRTWSQDEVETVRQAAERMWSEIERARSDAALVEAKETLERRVEERTLRLQDAVEEAEAFNYSVSHDLRAPLRAIAATAQILLEEAGDALSPDHRRLLGRQVHNAHRLGRLIDELLRLSRLARVPVRKVPLDLTQEAREVVAELSAAGMSADCDFVVQEGMVVEGDPSLVRSALRNLLENACKFSPNGGTVRVTQDGPVVSVSDEGIGFDMRYAHKLFRPFERLVHEGEFPGTGIGLASVERIVRRHGGKVWAESEPGKGATFSFTLGDPSSAALGTKEAPRPPEGRGEG